PPHNRDSERLIPELPTTARGCAPGGRGRFVFPRQTIPLASFDIAGAVTYFGATDSPLSGPSRHRPAPSTTKQTRRRRGEWVHAGPGGARPAVRGRGRPPGREFAGQRDAGRGGVRRARGGRRPRSPPVRRPALPRPDLPRPGPAAPRRLRGLPPSQDRPR